jgi:hypothetical protein
LSASAIIEAPDDPILLAVKSHINRQHLPSRSRFVSGVFNLSASAIIEAPESPILFSVKYMYQ